MAWINKTIIEDVIILTIIAITIPTSAACLNDAINRVE